MLNPKPLNPCLSITLKRCCHLFACCLWGNWGPKLHKLLLQLYYTVEQVNLGKSPHGKAIFIIIVSGLLSISHTCALGTVSHTSLTLSLVYIFFFSCTPYLQNNDSLLSNIIILPGQLAGGLPSSQQFDLVFIPTLGSTWWQQGHCTEIDSHRRRCLRSGGFTLPGWSWASTVLFQPTSLTNFLNSPGGVVNKTKTYLCSLSLGWASNPS